MSFDEWTCFGIDEHIQEQAMQWLLAQEHSPLNYAQQQQLHDWLAQDPLHLWAYEELSALWAKSATLHTLEVALTPLVTVPASPPYFLSPFYQHAPFWVIALAGIPLLFHMVL